MMPTFSKVGLDALLTPENCAVLLIDHQPSQLANVNSHDPTLVVNNVTALAKTAKARPLDSPSVLSSVGPRRVVFSMRPEPVASTQAIGEIRHHRHRRLGGLVDLLEIVAVRIGVR
jgi:hypothetical protein